MALRSGIYQTQVNDSYFTACSEEVAALLHFLPIRTVQSVIKTSSGSAVAAKVEAESRPLSVNLSTENSFAHQVTLENSDILFPCTLKALSFHITIDESDIEATMVLVKIQMLFRLKKMVFHC